MIFNLSGNITLSNLLPSYAIISLIINIHLLSFVFIISPSNKVFLNNDGSNKPRPNIILGFSYPV